jgi:transketolase
MKQETATFSRKIAEVILQQSYRANVGHIGSALSIADIIAVLYNDILDTSSVVHEMQRDRVILSKGHAALALYAALYLRGDISEEELNTYCGDASLLGVHPDHKLQGIDFSTGSLGHGLSLGAGAALAAKWQGSSRCVFVVLSDAECNEGSVWEAIMFAAHHHLANLIAIVDLNRQQALGYTSDVLNMTSMADRWQAFGWDVHDVDGHDLTVLHQAISKLDTATGSPHVLIAHTTFGNGVSYMEGRIKWHYLPMSRDEYQQALSEIRSKQ